MKQAPSIVRKKIKLTIGIAGIGSASSILGWLINSKIIIIIGLIIVALSPYIYLVIMLRKLRAKT